MLVPSILSSLFSAYCWWSSWPRKASPVHSEVHRHSAVKMLSFSANTSIFMYFSWLLIHHLQDWKNFTCIIDFNLNNFKNLFHINISAFYYTGGSAYFCAKPTRKVWTLDFAPEQQHQWQYNSQSFTHWHNHLLFMFV